MNNSVVNLYNKELMFISHKKQTFLLNQDLTFNSHSLHRELISHSLHRELISHNHKDQTFLIHKNTEIGTLHNLYLTIKKLMLLIHKNKETEMFHIHNNKKLMSSMDKKTWELVRNKRELI